MVRPLFAALRARGRGQGIALRELRRLPRDAARDPRAQKRVHALRSAQTRAFIETMYKGAVLPAF